MGYATQTDIRYCVVEIYGSTANAGSVVGDYDSNKEDDAKADSSSSSFNNIDI